MSDIILPKEEFIKFLFEKKTPLKIDFISSGMKNSDLPPSTVPEFAIVGRSNVGKSSLLNFLAGQKQLARVSNTPGRTQTINLFSVEKGEFLIVDLPGYGFAKSSIETKAQWQFAMRDYFQNRRGLFAVLFLIDIRRDILPEDENISRWLQSIGIKVLGIQTKADKIHKSKWHKIVEEQALKLALSPEQIVTTSSYDKYGLNELMQALSGMLDSFIDDQNSK